MVNLLIKKLSMLFLLVFVLVMFSISLSDLETLYNNAGKVFFSSNGYFDTGSRNLVTAIYLDYRLFDSLFEAGILLVAVSGVLWISQHKIKEKNATFMMDKQKTPELFITFGRLLYPVMLLFGLYIILNGHRSPGGGFQGGAIIATAILILYYIDISKEIDVQTIITIEKILFLLLVSISFLSFFTRGDIMTNFIPLNGDIAYKQIYLYLLNIIIGVKVALGLVAVFTSFLKVNYVGLVNILSQKEICRELLQQDATPENLLKEAMGLLDNMETQAGQIRAFDQIRADLGEVHSSSAVAAILQKQV